MSDTCLIGDTMVSRHKVIQALVAAYTELAMGREVFICHALDSVAFCDPCMTKECAALKELIHRRLDGVVSYAGWILIHHPELYQGGDAGKLLHGRMSWITDLIREFKECE